jgi:hypothetical protein
MTLIGTSKDDKRNDIEVLDRSSYFEHQGVWAYGFAAAKLSKSEVGQAVLAGPGKSCRSPETSRDAD